MNSQQQIQDELSSLQSGLPLNNSQPFSVPEGYFEGLAASVLAKVQSPESSVESELQELSPLLVSIPKKMPYSVPSFYFQESMEGVPAMFEEKEAAFLTSVGKAMPYTLPQGYFDELPAQTLARVALAKAKVVPLFARKWMRMAAAAVVGGALFLAGSQYFTKDQQSTAIHNDTVNQTQIASTVPVIKQELKKASTQELEEFIKTVQSDAAKESNQQTASPDKGKVKKLLKDVSDEEMESFLSALPVDDELFATD